MGYLQSGVVAWKEGSKVAKYINTNPARAQLLKSDLV